MSIYATLWRLKAIHSLHSFLRHWKGEAYASIRFDALWRLLCDALRGDSPRTVGTWLAPDGSARVFFDDGTSRQVDA